MLAHDLKPMLEQIWQLPVITLADTRPQRPRPSWVCACGDEAGAMYYACQRNRSQENNTPILIAFEADPTDMIVDGRDFLYTLFQNGNPDRARPAAELLFGNAILRYVDRAWSTSDTPRIAICDLAVQDDAVVSAHATNRVVIGGRYQTRFCSAFFVKVPVPPVRIIDVRVVSPDADLPPPEIELTALIR
jgi:hypothetical protein